MQSPPASTMKLRRNVHVDWKINITAQSAVKIDTEMLEHSADGNLFSTCTGACANEIIPNR
jgi:hypothetical protein